MQFIRTLALAVVATSAVILSPVVAQFPGGKFQCAAFLNTTEPPAELLVGVVIFDKVTSLDHVGPSTYLEMFDWSGSPVRFITIGARTGGTGPDSYLPQHMTVSYKDAPTKLDVLLIPGGLGTAGVVKDAGFMKYLTTAAEQSKHVLSVCTGANILATTGALDGRKATTNKVMYKVISANHPKVKWQPKARWVVDGKFWTSSGVSAGLDMGHAFITALSNEKLADCIARDMEIIPNKDPSNDPFEVLIDN